MKTRILIFMALVAIAVIFAGCSGSITQSDPHNFMQVSINGLQQSLGPNTVIVAVASGDYHSLALTNDGAVYAAGSNYYGQLGFQYPAYNSNGCWILSVNGGVKAIACGDGFSLFLSNDGRVWGTGRNNYGQLGNKDNDDLHIWTQSTFKVGEVVSIACGGDHSMYITSEGIVYATGRNNRGQLAVYSNSDCNIWTSTRSYGVGVKAIACGYEHSALLSNTGKVYTAGDNSYGQLATGNFDNTNHWTETPNGGDVKTIACGSFHTVCLDKWGHVWGAGNNRHGELTGEPDYPYYKTGWTKTIDGGNVIAIACGCDSTFALSSGHLWASGDNIYGQLGVGDTVEHYLWTPCK